MQFRNFGASVRWLALLLVMPGCLQYTLVMGNPSQKASAYKRVIRDAVGDAGEKEDCPRWIAGINSIRETLPIVSSGGSNRTWYGDEIALAYHRCTIKAMKALISGEGAPVERHQRAVQQFDLILSMPLAPLKLKDEKLGGHYSDAVLPGEESLRALRARTAERAVELEKAQIAKVARENKRIAAAQAAQSKGLHLAALAAWLAVDPLDDAMKTAKTTAIASLAGPAQQLLAVPVAVVAAKTDAAPEAVLAAVRAAPTLTGLATMKLLPTRAERAVVAELAVSAASKAANKVAVDMQHSYVSGSQMVPNPEIEKLQKDIAHFEKEARWNDDHAASACKNQRDPSKCTTRTVHQNNARSMREKAAKAREQLARAKPTVRKDVTDVFAYTADKTVHTATATVALGLSAPGRSPVKQSGTAKVERTTIAYPGNPKVGLAPRADAVPTPEELDAALAAECARLLAGGITAAPAQLAGEFDSQAAAASDPIEKLNFALIRSLRSGAAADAKVTDELGQAVLEAALKPAELLRALGKASGAGK